MAELDEILKLAVGQHASDIHFSAGEPIRFRVHGELVPITEGPATAQQLEKMLFPILTDSEREKFHKTRNLDKSYSLQDGGFFRVNLFVTRRGIAAVLRTIPQTIPTMSDLDLPPAAKKLADSPKGLVLVTGPTGSGKSTTLASMIHYINQNYKYHILTAEDPVEFVHHSIKSLINQREIGTNCPTFADALKFALREDPDVILVGEMRDLETIALALTAAETGHLVFATLHTRGAGPSVDRIIDSFPANQQAMIRTMLAESLVGVISQSLLKRADNSGRVAAFEILIVNHAISNLIREGKTFQMPSIIQTGRKEGMMLMDQSILDLVDRGHVTIDEARAYMEDASALASRRGRAQVSAAQPIEAKETRLEFKSDPLPELRPEARPEARREVKTEKPKAKVAPPLEAPAPRAPGALPQPPRPPVRLVKEPTPPPPVEDVIVAEEAPLAEAPELLVEEPLNEIPELAVEVSAEAEPQETPESLGIEDTDTGREQREITLAAGIPEEVWEMAEKEQVTNAVAPTVKPPPPPTPLPSAKRHLPPPPPPPMKKKAG